MKARHAGWGLCFVALACSSVTRPDWQAAPADAGSTAAPAEPTFEPVGESVLVRGIVQSPNGLVPIPNALVYVADDVPENRSDVCGACIDLGRNASYTFTDADGTFQLLARPGSHLIVTQKGRFRRTRRIEVVGREMALAASITRLPPLHAPENGDEAPRFGVVLGGPDPVEETLRKFGLWSEAITTFTTPDTALLDASLDDRLDVLMLPCGDGADLAGDPSAIAHLRGFVRGGGRALVSDYRYEFAARTWPRSFLWEEREPMEGSTYCLACGSAYEVPAVVEDYRLRRWLDVQGVGSFHVNENYTKLLEVAARPGLDRNGAAALIAPRVWMRGQLSDGRALPTTASLDDGCGRVVLTTHHTQAAAAPLLTPQELVMLYALFDEEVCLRQPEQRAPR